MARSMRAVRVRVHVRVRTVHVRAPESTVNLHREWKRITWLKRTRDGAADLPHHAVPYWLISTDKQGTVRKNILSRKVNPNNLLKIPKRAWTRKCRILTRRRRCDECETGTTSKGFHMSYTLTLTKQERDAIDWIGDRYWHGDDFRKIIREYVGIKALPPEGKTEVERDEEMESDNYEWDSNNTFEYTISESYAWEIREHIEDEDGDNLACFSPDFCQKLYEFCGKIV